MVIFETPAGALGRGPRVATFGSCRVANPFFALRDLGDLRICDAALAATHSASEALQTLRFVLGQVSIPDWLSPFVFEIETTPDPSRIAATLRRGVDATIVEISDRRQFVFDGFYLQQNFLSRVLVQPSRGALLPWYREVSACGGATAECVADALERLRSGGRAPDERVAELLSRIQLERPDRAEIARTIEAMRQRLDCAWVVVGAITVPGLDGAIMADRRVLNADLATICQENGARFFDPARLVAEHGPERVLELGRQSQRVRAILFSHRRPRARQRGACGGWRPGLDRH